MNFDIGLVHVFNMIPTFKHITFIVNLTKIFINVGGGGGGGGGLNFNVTMTPNRKETDYTIYKSSRVNLNMTTNKLFL